MNEKGSKMMRPESAMKNESPVNNGNAWISLVDLGWNRKESKEVSLTIIAPEKWGTDVMWIKKGQQIEASITVELVPEGVFLSGQALTTANQICVRCLDENKVDFRVDVSELVVTPEYQAKQISLGDEEAQDFAVIEDNKVNIEAILVDAFIAQMPFQPLCDLECAGLCGECGEKLDELEPDHRHEQIDPRFSSLRSLLNQESTGD